MDLARTTLPHLSPASPSRLSLSQVRAAHLETTAAAVTLGGLLGRGKNAAVYAAEVLIGPVRGAGEDRGRSQRTLRGNAVVHCMHAVLARALPIARALLRSCHDLH